MHGGRMKYAFVKQKDVADCGVACIEMIAKTYGANLKASSIRKVTKTDKDGTTILGILNDPPKMVHRSTWMVRL